MIRRLLERMGLLAPPFSPLADDGDDDDDKPNVGRQENPSGSAVYGWYSSEAAREGVTCLYEAVGRASHDVVVVTFVDSTPHSSEEAARARNPYADGPFAGSARFVGPVGAYVGTVESTTAARPSSVFDAARRM